MRDDGYDISDYRRINKAFGTRRDFRRLVREAHRRGIRVITELVINHTSDQHPWFQAARRAPRGSAKRNYYVWSDSADKYAGTRIIFTDTEKSNWTWDPVAQQYYWHRFFSHQPDLNFDNPAVVRAVIRIMRFWLDMGVDGVRLDAIPYLVEREGTSNENLPETHAVVKQMRKVVDDHYDDRLFLGEANMWPEDVLEYFGDGDECHMAYHFPLMPRMYMALAQEERHPIVEILEQTPSIPDSCQWAMFLRNHDELTLEMVTDEERDYMYKTYATDPRARINVGIRRRLAPLLDNDESKIKLLTSLLLSMPGSPILYYGDEIGMGDNIYLGDRNGVRTPMQWSPDRNAGFSTADPQQLYLPPVMDPVYGYEAVNVEAQSREMSSLLNWTRRMIAVRKSSQVFGRGELSLLSPGNRHVLAYLREYEGETILCVANLAGNAQPVELDLSRFSGRIPVEMMGRSTFPPIGELPYFLTLDGHGFFWFRLTSEAEVPEWHAESAPSTALATLVLSEHWNSFFPERLSQEQQRVSENMLRRLTGNSLPRYLEGTRWFGTNRKPVKKVDIVKRGIWESGDADYLFLWVRDTADVSGNVSRMPLALAWGSDADEPVGSHLGYAVARVRDRAETGLLFEAIRDRSFCAAVIDAVRHGKRFECGGMMLRGSSVQATASLLDGLDFAGEFSLPSSGPRHSSAIIDERVVLKFVREDTAGNRPELDIARFLTEQTQFPGFPRLLGDLSVVDDDGTSVLAIVTEYRRNQGDVGRFIHHHLDRFLDDARLRPADKTREMLTQIHAQSLAILSTLGKRLAELHQALCRGDGDLAPVAVGDGEAEQWKSGIADRADAAVAAAGEQLALLGDHERSGINERLISPEALRAFIDHQSVNRFRGKKSHYHGDLDLGHALLAESDIVFSDFCTDPLIEFEGRESKQTPLRDAAEVLRSIDRSVQSVLQGFPDLTGSDLAVLSGFASNWQSRANAAFVDSYVESLGTEAIAGPDAEVIGSMIRLLSLEKLMFEVTHPELRPLGDPRLAVRSFVNLLQTTEDT